VAAGEIDATEGRDVVTDTDVVVGDRHRPGELLLVAEA
jgi:hypothetical protein